MTGGPSRREYLLTAALAGAAGLAGCSNGETDAEATDEDAESADETPTLSPSTTLSPSPSGSTDDTGGGVQTDVTTRAENSRFAADDTEVGSSHGRSTNHVVEAIGSTRRGASAFVGAGRGDRKNSHSMTLSTTCTPFASICNL